MTGQGTMNCPCGSGQTFAECHGKPSQVGDLDGRAVAVATTVHLDVSLRSSQPSQEGSALDEPAPPPGRDDLLSPTHDFGPHAGYFEVNEPLEAAPAPVTRKLDLAAGQSPRAGFEGVDIFPGAQHVVNLQAYPWPFADESVQELNCSHYIEHIPMNHILVVDQGQGPVTLPWFDTGHPQAKDALFAFFDECWRILVPDGWLHVVVPCHRNDRAFQDPTHRRFITAQTFAYLNEEWRRINSLDHYNVICNFAGSCHPIVDASMNLRHAEAAQLIMQRQWNTVVDWTCSMQKKPRLPPRGA